MKGILLVNMGSPSSLIEMRKFLFNMFKDKAILPLPILPRIFLATLISTFRHYNSWQKYKLIGGSPLKLAMNTIMQELQQKIGEDYHVQVAYSYSNPLIAESIHSLEQKGVTEIIVLPMYPHASFTTTGSIASQLEKIKKTSTIPITMLGNYGVKESFISYWIQLIKTSIDDNGYNNPTLVFSAHAVPYYTIEQGDTYEEEIKSSAREIASRMGLRHWVAFQSKIGRIKWTGPATKDCIKDMKTNDIDEIILVPISFINENLETLYDQDYEILPYGKNELGIKHICRVRIPASHPLLIETFKKLIQEMKRT